MKKNLHLLKLYIFAVLIIAMTGTVTAQTNQTVCAGQSATLTASGGTSFSWNTGDTTASTVVTPAATSQYWVTVTLSGNTSIDTVTVTVNQNPQASISGNSTINAGNYDTLTASGGTSYTWSSGTTSIITTNAIVTVAPTTTSTYTVTVTNTGCTATSSITVTVNNPPPTETVFNICTGQSVQLTAPTGLTYQWTTGDTTQSAIVSPSKSQIFYVTVTEATNTVVDSFLVNIKPNPVVYAGSDVISPSPGSAVTLTATDSTDANAYFQWSYVSTTDKKVIYLQGSPASTGASVTVNPRTTTLYTVTVKNTAGCTADGNVSVIVNNIHSSAIFVGNDSAGHSSIYTMPDSALYLQSVISPADTGRNTIINSNNAGRVGIGTNNPKEKLDVNGNANISGSIAFGNGAKIIHYPATDSTFETISVSGGGTHVIPPPPPINMFCVNPPITSNNTMHLFDGMVAAVGSPTGYILPALENATIIGYDGQDCFLEALGANPNSQYPRLLIDNYCGKSVIVGTPGSNAMQYFNARHSAYFATLDGNVGIGTSTPYPYSNLEVLSPNNAEIRLTSTSTNSSILWADNANYAYGFGVDASGNGHIYRDINTPSSLMTFENGNVGINTNPLFRLDVNGDINFSGALYAGSNCGTYPQILVSQGPGTPPLWQSISTPTNAWLLTGNAGTSPGPLPGNNFMGTTDDNDVVFDRNNIQAGWLNEPMFPGPDERIPSHALLSVYPPYNQPLGNTAWGVGALEQDYDGYSNTAIGVWALASNNNGLSNTAIGVNALEMNNGNFNTATGVSALKQNTIGDTNTATGMWALLSNQIGNGNTAIGYWALFNNNVTGVDGNHNTAIGVFAGHSNNAGSYNTLLGANTDVNVTNLTNATAIGAHATVSESDAIILGGPDPINGVQWPVVGIGTPMPSHTYALEVDGEPATTFSSSWIWISDIRVKKDTSAFTDGLAVIKKIHPVNFKYNGKAGINDTVSSKIGIIAQQLQPVAPYSVGTYLAKLDTSDTEPTQLLNFDAGPLLFVAINAIKTLASTNDSLKQVITTYKIIQDSINNAIQSQINQCCNNNSLGKVLNTDSSNFSNNTQHVDLANQAILYNAYPDPFTETTIIKFFIPSTVSSAFITFYDEYGNELQRTPIAQTGAGQIVISSSNLSAGIYSYSLTINGNLIDTKRMVKVK